MLLDHSVLTEGCRGLRSGSVATTFWTESWLLRPGRDCASHGSHQFIYSITSVLKELAGSLTWSALPWAARESVRQVEFFLFTYKKGYYTDPI